MPPLLPRSRSASVGSHVSLGGGDKPWRVSTPVYDTAISPTFSSPQSRRRGRSPVVTGDLSFNGPQVDMNICDKKLILNMNNYNKKYF